MCRCNSKYCDTCNRCYQPQPLPMAQRLLIEMQESKERAERERLRKKEDDLAVIYGDGVYKNINWGELIASAKDPQSLVGKHMVIHHTTIQQTERSRMNTKKELELARQAIVRQQAQIEEQLQKYENFPEGDEYPHGALIRFDRTITVKKSRDPWDMESVEKTLVYAALKAYNDKWYFTGDHRSGLTWEETMDQIIEFGVTKLIVLEPGVAEGVTINLGD